VLTTVDKCIGTAIKSKEVVEWGFKSQPVFQTSSDSISY
jgi:hypothetical protein